MDENDILEHFGIKGMRWGVRRARGSRKSEDYKESRRLKKKAKVKTKALSNAELKKLNERLQLEQNYTNLKNQKYNRGMKVARDVLAIGTTISSAYAFAQSDAGKAVKNILVNAAKKAVKNR